MSPPPNTEGGGRPPRVRGRRMTLQTTSAWVEVYGGATEV